MWHILLTALALVLPCAAVAQSAAPQVDTPQVDSPKVDNPKLDNPHTNGPQVDSAHVYSDAGNIFIDRNGVKTQLTTSEEDVDPMLSPDGAVVVYTRQGRGRSVHGYDVDQVCSVSPRPDQLRQVNADGSGDRLLLDGHKGAPDQQLCDFRSKQFSSDGRRLYFIAPAWTTSGAVHVYDRSSGDEHFLLPGNDVLVLSFCANKYKDDLVVLSHRALLFGGSYDWYWLYDPTGRKELGPLGPFDSPDDMAKRAHQQWCRS